MIIIHAHITVNPGQRDAFLEQAQELMKHSKAEEGNISYHLYEDAVQPNSFVMVEEWKDNEAIKIHEETPHFQSFLNAAKTMLAKPLQATLYEAKKL